MKHTAPPTTLGSRTLWHNIVSTIIILAIATILAFSFFHITQSDPANIALIYILALIIIARITTGYFFGIISAFFCVIFINWCFTYPYFKVSFAISGYPVTFVFLLTISMIVSTLTTRLILSIPKLTGRLSCKYQKNLIPLHSMSLITERELMNRPFL